MRQAKIRVRVQAVAVDRDGERRATTCSSPASDTRTLRLVVPGLAGDRFRGRASSRRGCAASSSFSPSMLWRVASRSFCRHRRGEDRRRRAARAASSSTTSDSSGSAQLEARRRERLAQLDLAREPVRRDQVIVAELLHRAVAIDAHLERARRRPSRPRPVRGSAGRRRPALAAAGGACSRGGAAQPARISEERATGTCASAYSPRPDAGAKHFRALRLGGADPALGDRRAADRPGDARQDRRTNCPSGSRGW